MYMTGESLTPPLNTLFKKNIPESIFKSVPGIAPKKRTPMPELPVDKRTKSFVEADLVITEADAVYEANRCLNCCIYCYNPGNT
jgi:formate dehydrogenase (NADP+) beta subunit